MFLLYSFCKFSKESVDELKEKLKVLNVDRINSRIRVLREVEGTTGSSHTIGKLIYEVPRKFTVNSGFKTDYSYRQNRQIYFNPVNVVGLGTTAGVGSELQSHL